MTFVQMFMELQVLLTLFLVILFRSLQDRLPHREFFRLWTCAWFWFGLFLTFGWLSISLGPEWTLLKGAAVLISTVAGYLQVPLFFLGALSLRRKFRRRWLKLTVQVTLLVATGLFALSMANAANPQLSYALRSFPRQILLAVACFSGAIIFLHWRKTRTRGVLVTAVSCFLGGVLYLLNALRVSQPLVAGDPNLLKEILAAVMLDEMRWFYMDVIWQCGIALGMILFLLEDYARAEIALRQSERKFHKAFHSIPDIIVISEAASGLMIEVNDNFTRITGHPRHEVIGRTAIELGLWDDPKDREATVAALRASGRVRDLELGFRARNGELRLGLLSAETIELDGRECLLHVVRDVSERKQLEDQLRQAQKMEAVGQLAGGIAHDFNNLLMVIGGYADLLLERLEPGHPARRHAEQILKAGQRASGLTRQLLAFSRKQVLQPRVIDLNHLVLELGKMLPRVIREDIDLSIVPGAKHGAVLADPNQIEQVIMNLVVNARDAMPRGGRLTIETDNARFDEEHPANHASMPPGDYVMLAVSDTGIGMDSATQRRIFEPFFTTKEQGKGTGLGLATVYGIVKQSGGFIWVYSEPGQGAAFKVYLPQSTVSVEMDSPLSDAPIFRGTETVLLVEDEDEVRSLTSEFLSRSGYTVIEARGPAEALALSEAAMGPIHVIVTDVVMPGMSGPELADLLVDRHPEAKVLYVSGYAEEAIVHHGILDRGATLVDKPFNRTTLVHKMRELLDGRSVSSLSRPTPSS